MPAYLTLFNFTDQGVRTAKDTAKRAKAVTEAWEKAGGRIIGFWWTLGQYDGFVVHETPDEETATRLLLSVGILGNVRTTTMRAFSEEEMARIIQKLT